MFEESNIQAINKEVSWRLCNGAGHPTAEETIELAMVHLASTFPLSNDCFLVFDHTMFMVWLEYAGKKLKEQPTKGNGFVSRTTYINNTEVREMKRTPKKKKKSKVIFNFQSS